MTPLQIQDAAVGRYYPAEHLTTADYSKVNVFIFSPLLRGETMTKSFYFLLETTPKMAVTV